MNQGMYYGLAGSQSSGGALRKLAGQLGRSYLFANPATGGAYTGTPLTAGVRTRLLSILGRGALRIASLTNNTGGNANMRLEVVLDGVVIADTGTLNASNSQGICPVGYPANSGSPLFWDWVPFDSSLEIWATSSVTGTSGAYTFQYVADIHQ